MTFSRWILGVFITLAVVAYGLLYLYERTTGGDIYDLTDMFSDPIELSQEELTTLYKSERPGLIEKYQRGDNEYALRYPEFEAASTIPANPGVHSGRYMMTFVNEIGFDTYVQYGSDPMPTGSVIAKESFKVRPNGQFFPYSLFIMEKVGVEEAPDTNGWYYDRILRDGSPAGASQKFCHSCHGAYANQDSLGYPVREARINYTPPDPNAAPVEYVAGDVERGKAAFSTCAGCHAVGPDAVNKFGPVLNNVIGREAGTYPGYSFSPSLRKAGQQDLVWTEELIFNWLAGPSEFLQEYLDDPGARSKMPLHIDDAQQRSDLIAYLKSLPAGKEPEE